MVVSDREGDLPGCPRPRVIPRVGLTQTPGPALQTGVGGVQLEAGAGYASDGTQPALGECAESDAIPGAVRSRNARGGDTNIELAAVE